MSPFTASYDCPRCGKETITVVYEDGPSEWRFESPVCDTAPWTEAEREALTDDARAEFWPHYATRHADGDDELPTYDESLAASLPSQSYRDAMMDAGRGHLLP